MGFFRKRTAEVDGPPPRPRFGPGRRFSSAQDLGNCEKTIEHVLDTYAPTKYQYMPSLHRSAVTWFGEAPAPTEAWTCDYGDDVFVFAMWSQPSGTEIGLFPLGSNEALMDTPLIGQWKVADVSLKSTGRFEPGQFTLLPPVFDVTYFEGILHLAGKPNTPANVATVAAQVNQMFVIKAWEFISRAGHDERAANAFVDSHHWNGDITLPQRVLADLADRDFKVVPYIQDLPSRIQGLLLEPGPNGQPTADIWDTM